MHPLGRPKFKVAICGGGIAGLTVAAFLSKSPAIELYVLEAKSDIRAIGAGIAIWKRCWDILEDTIDFEAKCSAHELKLSRWPEVKGPVLRKADNFPYFDFCSLPLGPRILPRDTLLDILHKDLDKGNCHVQTKKKLLSWERYGLQNVIIRFDDGTSAVVDLLIGADGIHSQVRRRIFERNSIFSEPKFSGQFAYRMSCTKAEIVKLKADHQALKGFKIWCGNGRHVTSNMVRDNIQITAYDNVFDPDGQPPPFDGPWVAEVPATEIAERYEGWEPDLVSLLRMPKVASRWAIHVVHPLPTFVADRVCLIGDAAHAMTPHQGLGGNQGIEDAYLLAQLLLDPHTTASNIPDALRIYDSIRRPFSQDVARRSLTCGLMYGFLDLEYRGASLQAMGEELITSCRWLTHGDGATGEWTKAQSMLAALPPPAEESESP